MLGAVGKLVLFLSTLILLSMPLSASAQSEALQAARAQVENQEFEDAQESLTLLLESGELGPEQLVEVYSSLAECAAALRQPDVATDAFVRLLAIQPDYYVSSSASPLLREPFEQALSHWNENERPSLQYQPPQSIADDEPYVIRLNIDQESMPSLFATVRLHYRTDPTAFFTTVDFQNGQAEIPEDSLEDTESVELYLSVHDDYGNVVARAGSPEEPIEIAVGEASGPVEQQDGNGHGQRRPIYQRWWFWTIIGAAVVGLAVGLPVGLTRSGQDDPCVDVLGGTCDLEVSLGR